MIVQNKFVVCQPLFMTLKLQEIPKVGLGCYQFREAGMSIVYIRAEFLNLVFVDDWGSEHVSKGPQTHLIVKAIILFLYMQGVCG